MTARGRVVILNGVPRSGKSSIVAAMQAADPGWFNLGVDTVMRMTPHLRPSIGLRPGGEGPDLEPYVARIFGWMYATIADFAIRGTDVVVDVGHHDSYSRPLDTLGIAARSLQGVPAWLVGVRCPLDVVLDRREAAGPGRYLGRAADGSVPEPVLRFEAAVHDPGIYDLEVDTSSGSPEECAAEILAALDEVLPSALGGFL